MTLIEKIKLVDNFYLNNDCACEIGGIDPDYEICDSCKCASILNDLSDDLGQFIEYNNFLQPQENQK